MRVCLPGAKRFSPGSSQWVQCVLAAFRVSARRSIGCLPCPRLWLWFGASFLGAPCHDPVRAGSQVPCKPLERLAFPAVFSCTSTFFPAQLHAVLQLLVTQTLSVGAKRQNLCEDPLQKWCLHSQASRRVR